MVEKSSAESWALLDADEPGACICAKLQWEVTSPHRPERDQRLDLANRNGSTSCMRNETVFEAGRWRLAEGESFHLSGLLGKGKPSQCGSESACQSTN